MKPREMKKARTMSQITTSEKPLMESAMLRVPVRVVAAMPMMATAPMGRALTMMPAMVATKRAKRCRPFSQSAFRLVSASTLALASVLALASASVLASASALAWASASALAWASASALALASAWILVKGFASPWVVVCATGAVGLASGFGAGLAGVAGTGFAATGCPVNSLASGTCISLGNPKYSKRPSTTVTSAGPGLAPCRPDSPPVGGAAGTDAWVMASLHEAVFRA